MAIGIGIIGAGGISHAHAHGYLQIPDEARIVGVADIVEERAKAAAQEWGAEYAFGDYRELLALAEVEAVSVCTYTTAHCEPTVAALQRGKHVIVEKPMAATTAEAHQMVEAQRTSGKILMVGMKWRFMPEIQAAKAFIEAETSDRSITPKPLAGSTVVSPAEHSSKKRQPAVEALWIMVSIRLTLCST